MPSRLSSGGPAAATKVAGAMGGEVERDAGDFVGLVGDACVVAVMGLVGGERGRNVLVAVGLVAVLMMMGLVAVVVVSGAVEEVVEAIVVVFGVVFEVGCRLVSGCIDVRMD
jgi:hypothetical protein